VRSTILITGANGFIGSHLVESLLRQGKYVRAVDLHTNTLQSFPAHPQLEVMAGDLIVADLRKKIVSGIDTIYHLASAHLDTSLPDDHYRQVNLHATFELARAAHAAGVRRFVHCSSVGVIGDVKHPPADEETPCHPTNIYELTKLEGERAVLSFAAESGFDLVVNRPAWVYGPRCPRTQKLLRTITKGRFIFFGNGQNMRHPIYISDLIFGLEQCATAEDVAGQIFILAGPEPVTTRQLVSTVAELSGRKPPRLSLPLWIGKASGTVLELVFKTLHRPPPFSSRSLDFFSKNNAYSIEKARRVLGFQPTIRLADGLQKTFLHYRDQISSAT
jgi:nucleoside-diphosphate-sugar epimerase